MTTFMPSKTRLVPAPAASAPPSRRVVDAPIRMFHWLFALCFVGAYITADGDSWRLLHVTLGYTLAGLLVFRVLWGLIGTRHARFTDFVRGPGAVRRYLAALLRGQPEHAVGHNPAGALAILALLALGAASAVSGWAVYNQLGGEGLEEAHELAASLMLAVVGVHILGVLVASRLHRENLAASMITGRKRGRPEQGIRSAWRSVAALMLVAVLVGHDETRSMTTRRRRWQSTTCQPVQLAGRQFCFHRQTAV